MTVKELFEQMLALGGKTQWAYPYEPQARFPAANRALFEINRLFPVTKKIQLLNYPLIPVQFLKGITVHRGGEDIQIDASGITSLAFAVSGGGGKAYVYELTNNGERLIEEIEIAESATFITHKYIAGTPKDIRLVFTGAYNYMIRDASFYSELISDRAEDVKLYSPWVAYDIAGVKYLGERYLGIDGIPVRNDSVSLNSADDYKIDGSVVYLRADKPGIYEITVLTKPMPIVNGDENCELDIEPQLHDLVALRAAYYLYLVSDSEIADRCNNEYKSMLAFAKSNVKKTANPTQYRNTRRW